MVSRRRPSRKPGCGGTTPTLPITGSTITAAIRPRLASASRSTEARSLKRAIRVSRAVPAVTPGLPGMPRVSTPLPASIRKLSPWPW